MTAELGHLVEEEHTVVRETDLTRTWMLTAADECHVRDRVMRRPERAFGQQPGAGWQEPGYGVDGRRLERLIERQRREDGGHSPGHHGLAGARWPDHQHVVAAGGGNLECPPRQRLTMDIREVAIEANDLWRRAQRDRGW